jgi:hypothetical protein
MMRNIVELRTMDLEIVSVGKVPMCRLSRLRYKGDGLQVILALHCWQTGGARIHSRLAEFAWLLV